MKTLILLCLCLSSGLNRLQAADTLIIIFNSKDVRQRHNLENRNYPRHASKQKVYSSVYTLRSSNFAAPNTPDLFYIARFEDLSHTAKPALSGTCYEHLPSITLSSISTRADFIRLRATIHKKVLLLIDRSSTKTPCKPILVHGWFLEPVEGEVGF